MLELISATPLPVEVGYRRVWMLAHLPRLVHSDPLGPRKAWNQWNYEFCQNGEEAIYHLFDHEGEPLYFGKAWCPLYRFEAHQRKPWWPQVAHLNLYKVTCGDHPQERCGDLRDVTLAWERRSIEMVRPRYNIAHNQKVDA